MVAPHRYRGRLKLLTPPPIRPPHTAAIITATCGDRVRAGNRSAHNFYNTNYYEDMTESTVPRQWVCALLVVSHYKSSTKYVAAYIDYLPVSLNEFSIQSEKNTILLTLSLNCIYFYFFIFNIHICRIGFRPRVDVFELNVKTVLGIYCIVH